MYFWFLIKESVLEFLYVDFTYYFIVYSLCVGEKATDKMN